MTIRNNLTVTRVAFEGKRAVGVDVIQENRIKTIRAKKEVIICGGGYMSPHLLMLSGIGPADELRRAGIAPVHDSPGVGLNFQDHNDIRVQFLCTQPISYSKYMSPLGKMRVGIEWLLRGSGPGASNAWETGGLIKSSQDIDYGNIQLSFCPILTTGTRVVDATIHGFQVHLCLMRPESRGSVKLRSHNPLDAPRILFNHLQTHEDLRACREGIKRTREIIGHRAFDMYRGLELAPGKEVKSDGAIDEFLRATITPGYHVAGSCRMGNDEEAVVDPEGRVFGVENLRIVDASIMPTVPSGNTNAPVMMIAEKLSDRILGKPALPKLHPQLEQAADLSGLEPRESFSTSNVVG